MAKAFRDRNPLSFMRLYHKLNREEQQRELKHMREEEQLVIAVRSAHQKPGFTPASHNSSRIRSSAKRRKHGGTRGQFVRECCLNTHSLG